MASSTKRCSYCSQEWDDDRPTHVCGTQVVPYDDLAGLVRECDELRAEIERLGNHLRIVEGERDECSEGAMELRAENERLRWIIIAMQHGNEDALEQAKQMNMQGFVDFLNDADAAEW